MVSSSRIQTMTLKSDLAHLIKGSHQDTWGTFEWVRSHATRYGLSPTKTAKWRTPGEPAFVSSLLEFPFARRRLGRLIEEHLRPLGLSSTTPLVSGVFIHQKPKVKFRPFRGQVELGDLLLVRQHFKSAVATPQGRAFLVQAKSSNVPRTGALTGKEAQQFALYADWSTPFVFPNKELGKPPDGSKHWDLSRGPTPYPNSGVYGIVANEPVVPGAFPDACPWAVGVAQRPAAGTPQSVDASRWSLAEVMERFLLGNWGRPWDAAPPSGDHWSAFVIECLAAASTWRPYPVQRTGHPQAAALPRRRDVVGLVHAIAKAASDTVHPSFARFYPYAYAGVYDDELADKTQRAIALTSAWTQTLDKGDGGGKGGGGDDETVSDQPTPGLSVLYVATFGDGQLRGVDPQLTPWGDKPQGPEAGTRCTSTV